MCDPKNRQFINGIEANGAGSAGLNTPEKKESPFLPPPPTNSPAVSSWFSSVTPANSPAAIMSPWLRSGGGDAGNIIIISVYIYVIYNLSQDCIPARSGKMKKN